MFVCAQCANCCSRHLEDSSALIQVQKTETILDGLSRKAFSKGCLQKITGGAEEARPRVNL